MVEKLEIPFKAKYRGEKVLVINADDCTAWSPYVTIKVKGEYGLVSLNDLQY